MADYRVTRLGVDTSGRDILMTRYMADWWAGVCDRLGFTPTVVQGAFMARNGGGAAASAGYHDEGGCLDLRVWDLTDEQVGKTIRELRRSGAAAWVRDERHGGMDDHIHLVLGTDQPLASGAAWQWREYIAGHDGLASRGRDYHWRPDPLVLTPPTSEEDDMPYTDWPKKDRDALVADVAAAVLASKVTNRNAEGEVQGEISVSSILTNLERSQDMRFKQLRDEIRNLTLTTQEKA